jgi:SPP1 gp7 family putative phage head morphogenesis protein
MVEDLIDAITRHQIFVQRYAAGREKEVAEEVDAFIEKIIQTLEKDDITQYSQVRLELLLSELREESDRLHSEAEERLIAEILSFGKYEAEFSRKMLQESVSEPLQEPLEAILNGSILTTAMTLGVGQIYTFRSLLRTFREKKRTQLIQTVKDAVTIRSGIKELTNAVNSLGDLTKSQYASIIRTGINHVSIQARNVVMKENDNVFTGYEWVSVLDARTSLVCMSRDGKIYPFDDKSPKPPAHFGCRSSIVPVINPAFDIQSDKKGTRPAVGPKGSQQVGEDTVYEAWLKRQPYSFQIEVLGPSRARLFREGRLSIGRFVDDTGKTLTLDELRRLEPLAFERAGI